MKYLVILNDPPYGTERSYNGLRLASSLAKAEATYVSVFLIGDGVGCALSGQTTPNGYYNIGRMLKSLAIKRNKTLGMTRGWAPLVWSRKSRCCDEVLET